MLLGDITCYSEGDYFTKTHKSSTFMIIKHHSVFIEIATKISLWQFEFVLKEYMCGYVSMCLYLYAYMFVNAQYIHMHIYIYSVYSVYRVYICT